MGLPASPALLVGCSMLVLLASRVTAQKLACEESGYCSVGISQQWVGDIRESSDFKDMLSKVAYKQELIISIFQEEGEPVWVEQVQQMHQELLSMGYAHHLFVTLYPEACDMIKSPTMSCAWDSSDLPSNVFGGETALWHNRWKLIARASRLGYNIMSVDTDFIFFRDPYYHLKRPPLSAIQMLGAPEGGSNYNCNGGFMYVQNVRPDGPISWVFKQVVMSSLRRGDDKFEYMAKWSNSRMNCLTFDQSIIFDAIAAAGVGRPVFPNALGSCKNTDQKFRSRTGQKLTFQQVVDNVNHLVSAHMRTTTAHAPPDAAWLASLGLKPMPDDDTAYFVGNLTVPNLNYGYPEELGGRFAPPEPGPLSTAFIEQLKSDCPECPWWPEKRPLPAAGDPLDKVLGPSYNTPHITRDNINLHHDGAVQPEVYAQGPRWFETSLVNTRRGWFLGRASSLQGPQIMGHVHAWHMQTSRAHKTMLRKVLGRYNWTLGEGFAKASGHSTPYLMRGPVTHLLALSPHIDLARTRSWAELSSIIVGLLQAAHLSNRVVLMPDLPCETAWLHDQGSLDNADVRQTVCLAPMFWRQPYRYPIPVPVPVDERGELVGGWARRLTQQSTPASSQPHVTPLLLEPSYLMTAGWQQQQHGSSMQTRGMHDGSIHGRSARHRRRQLEQQRALLADAAADQLGAAAEPAAELADWWAKQRFVAVMPQLWDASCTRDMHGIITAEFFHWLKHSPHAKGVSLQPTAANTVMQPAQGQAQLQLKPPPPAGSLDSAAVPRGSVVTPSDQPGWSWKDVQVAVPALEVANALQQVADVPLVYLGHPLMVVHSHTRKHKQQGEAHIAAASEAPAAGVAMHFHADGTPLSADEIMARVDSHIRHSHCKAVWKQPETHSGELVDLEAGIPAKVENGCLAVAA